MKTAIRMDDITPDMDFEKFNRVRAILKRYSLCPLIGVVPYNKDTNLSKSEPDGHFSEFIKELTDEGYKVALHGYNHLYTTNKKGLFPLNNFSEFAGVEYEKQIEMLRRGLERFNEWNINTEIFMAPGHTFDNNTLRALKEVGITKITDGFGKEPFERNGITFYPIAKIRKECVAEKEGFSTMVLHTNAMSDEEIENFEKLIANNRACFIDYGEYLKKPSKKQTILERWCEYYTTLLKYLVMKIR